jgi:colanic acid biosynthesis glycosyl transferase WcaI
MKILILSQYYGPEPLPKAQDLAEGLRDHGHEVTVMTGFPNYPSGKVYPGYRMRPWAVETAHSLKIIRLVLYPDHSTSRMRRIANYVSFALAASIIGPFLCGRPDVMFVLHPPLTIGVAAWVLSRLKRMPFVYGVADLWPDAVVASGMLSNSRMIGVLKRLERFVYARAQAVAGVSPGMAVRLAERGVDRNKLHVISDWADERVYMPRPPDSALAHRLGMRGKFNILFAGQLGLVQKLDTVLQAAQILKPHAAIQFVIAGDGVERARLEQEARDRDLTNVRFVGRVPSADMPSVCALADVLLVHLSAHPTFRVSIPGKAYAYMACAKPVLMAVGGDAAELIRSSGAGLTCPPENPEAMAEAVLRFFRMPGAEREAMGLRGRECFVQGFSRSVVLRQCETLLESIAHGGVTASRDHGGPSRRRKIPN